MGIQLKLSAALFYTAAALAVQVMYIPTTTAAAAAHPGPAPGYPAAAPSELADRLLQVFYNAEQEQEMVQEQLQEEEMAESNGPIYGKKWWSTDYKPITTPRGYKVFALQVCSPSADIDHDDAYCLYTMRDNGRIRALPACVKPRKAKCSDYTVGSDHTVTVTVCEGLIKNRKFYSRKPDVYGPCYDPAKNSCPSS